MPPQKRGRAQKSKDETPAAAGAAQEQHASANGAAEVEMMDDDSSDDDSDSENDLTFAEKGSDEDSDDEDDDDSDADMEDASTAPGSSKQDRSVNVDFVFLDPRESHFHSVKQFLLSYLPPSQPFDVSGLADAIVNQVTTGTMVCADGEDDVYGFITALSLTRYAGETSIQQILQYVTKKCPAADATRFQSILSTKAVGLLLNERMVNLPYQLVAPIHAALHDDIEWAVEHEETPALRASFEFDYFLILASCAIEKTKSQSKKSQKKSKSTQYDVEAKFFHNFEDEFLEQAADVVFTFETPKSDRDAIGGEQASKTTVVMLIERTKHKAALATISAMINA